MIVVSDTSCITNLLAIGREGLLEALFSEVVIPQGVLRELQVEHKHLPAFLHARSVRNPNAVADIAREPLDLGEAEAIILAEELCADYLLMDESAGRAVALKRGLHVLGLLGVLSRAKTAGLIRTLRPLLDQLEREAGFWLSPELRKRVLEESREP